MAEKPPFTLDDIRKMDMESLDKFIAETEEQYSAAAEALTQAEDMFRPINELRYTAETRYRELSAEAYKAAIIHREDGGISE